MIFSVKHHLEDDNFLSCAPYDDHDDYDDVLPLEKDVSQHKEHWMVDLEQQAVVEMETVQEDHDDSNDFVADGHHEQLQGVHVIKAVELEISRSILLIASHDLHESSGDAAEVDHGVGGDYY